MSTRQLLQWYLESGVDETVTETPVNRLLAPPPPETGAAPMPKAAAVTSSRAGTVTPAAAIAEARALADAAKTLEELHDAIRGFGGCALKKTAQRTVISDGNPKAQVMVIGEAPGAQEDEQGIPFCGPSGQLLDRVLASIGLNRKETLYISNTVFWRPPGNRAPTPEELAICEPFVQKHIALIQPKVLVLAGGVAVNALLKLEQPIGRLRGKMLEYSTPYLPHKVAAIATFHPSYLLRSPGQKRLAWADMLNLQDFLKSS